VNALVFDGTRTAVRNDLPDPIPGPGEALIRPVRIAYSSADRAAAAGRLRFKGVLGHQFVGVVERVSPLPGRDEMAKWVGKRVVGGPVVACGVCPRCRGGLWAHCPDRQVLGLFGRDGCFAERFTLPIQNLVEVPKTIVDERAVFAPTVAAAAHAVAMCRLEGKPYVTVLGDGPVALCCAQLATRLNASVRVLGTRPERYTLCEKWGIKHRDVKDVGLRQDQDLVIDCTGSPDGLPLAIRLVRPRGKVILKTSPAPVPSAGLAEHEGRASVDLAHAVVNEIEILGASGGRVSEGLDAIAKGLVDVSTLRAVGLPRIMELPELLKDALRPAA
jgi:threonine dehydrogenase-like Zn-dependent dehydrogenase